MGSTEAASQVRLDAGHLAGCLALSKSAHWNQNEADWRLMLEQGTGWGLEAPDRTLVASTLILPYGGGDFAWISMVLVLPGDRGRGHATRLLRVAIAELGRRGLTPVLDATPAGREVYLQEGFADAWGFQRLFLDRSPATFPSSPAIRPMRESDWQAVLEMDLPAFGASREPLLRSLAARLPQAALVCEQQGTIAGFVLGRDGREARQLGPLVARDGQAAQALLAEGVRRAGAPIYVDVVDRAQDLARWARGAGFVLQRPFTRMVRGAPRAPGKEAGVFLVAGPELG
jgi:GNAT superfamily N-acetyltransferase